MTAKILFYVQSLWGVGHLSRASAIASACVEAGFDVTLVNGGPPVPGIVESKVRVVQLPPVRAADESYSKLVTISGNEVDEAFREARKAQLLATLGARPDVVVTETWPFGRRKLAFELVPFVETARALKPRPLVLSSVRDILVPPKIAERVREAVSRAKADFDAILVHGDEKVIALAESFPAAAEFSNQVRYTGYVVRKADVALAPKDRFDILVSAGGGRSGRALIAAALSASRTMDANLRWLLISGPQVGPAAYGDLAVNVTIAAHRPDLAQLMTKARVSVSQAGYNTVIESLAGGCHPVLVPFLREGEIEQLQRAERFAAPGLATLVRPDDLAELGVAVAKALVSRDGRSELPFRTDGAAETARIIDEMLEKRGR